MSDELHSGDYHWKIIPNFDGQSRFPYSSASGQPKRDGDPGIIRCIHGYVDMEGFFDITFYDAEQLAGLLGWVSPAKYAELERKLQEAEGEAKMARAKAFNDAQNALKMRAIKP